MTLITIVEVYFVKKLPKSQKGFVHILPLEVVFVLVAAGILIYLVAQGIIKIPSFPFLQKGPAVKPQETYKNPFKKETQYVNPFDTYKNPFTVNR